MITLSETHWAMLERQSEPEPNTGCRIWTGKVCRRGYGRMYIGYADNKRIVWQAHRVAYTVAIGPIPDGLECCHTCDVPSCVNPDHLFVGTKSDNMRDMVRKGRGVSVPHHARKRAAQTHCEHGHPFDAVNTHIRRNGRRACRACRRAYFQARRLAAGARPNPNMARPPKKETL